MSNRAGNGAVILGRDFRVQLTASTAQMLKFLAGGHSQHEALGIIVEDAIRARFAQIVATCLGTFAGAAVHGRWR